MLTKDLMMKVFNSVQWTGMAVLRACIDDVGELMLVKPGRKAQLKKRIFIWKENIITERSTQ